ncbi:hypothetical protein SARC_06018 [Sphaeroforma arctica JP610]|uniref:Uncharacterized protein n=1 Tax=Sphaeroforma arctica JP610 TaxID=667725 RepID=A0A0L0FYG9_9EUKA|nr:hypothetical protein SARC_06018 [Sphaeroforma arctica JP610]KNC81664.1 hypothetical protein SARC_06018 [Sphaeroforma arctica JP610]|eukprot:XP_014155566.1 hypothetical protein SARC_06018 [Sphaeroforma arctica JP610]
MLRANANWNDTDTDLGGTSGIVESSMGRHKRKRFTPNLSVSVLDSSQACRTNTNNVGISELSRDNIQDVHEISNNVVPEMAPGDTNTVAQLEEHVDTQTTNIMSSRVQLKSDRQHFSNACDIPVVETLKGPPPVWPSPQTRKHTTQTQLDQGKIKKSITPTGTRLFFGADTSSRDDCTSCGSREPPHTDVHGTYCSGCGHSQTAAASGPLVHSYDEVSSGWGHHAFHTDKRMVYGHVAWKQRCELDESRFITAIMSLLACTKESGRKTNIERAVDFLAYVRRLQQSAAVAFKAHTNSTNSPAMELEGQGVESNVDNSVNMQRGVRFKKRLHVDRRKEFVTACVYISLLNDQKPVTMQMITIASGLPLHKVGAAYKRVLQLFKSTSSTRPGAGTPTLHLKAGERSSGRDSSGGNETQRDETVRSDHSEMSEAIGVSQTSDSSVHEQIAIVGSGGVGMCVQKAPIESLVEGRISELHRNQVFYKLRFEGGDRIDEEAYTHAEKVSALFRKIEHSAKMFIALARVSGVSERRRVNSVLTVALAMAVYAEVQRQEICSTGSKYRSLDMDTTAFLGGYTSSEVDQRACGNLSKLTYYQVLELVSAGSDEMVASRKSMDQRALKITSREMHGVLLKFNNETAVAESVSGDVDCGKKTASACTPGGNSIAEEIGEAMDKNKHACAGTSVAKSATDLLRTTMGVSHKEATPALKKSRTGNAATFGRPRALTSAEVRKKAAMLTERYLRYMLDR